MDGLSNDTKNLGDDGIYREVYLGEQSHSPIDLFSNSACLGRAHMTCGYFDAGIPAMPEGTF